MLMSIIAQIKKMTCVRILPVYYRCFSILAILLFNEIFGAMRSLR